ncbi:MAG: DMT family transporter [Deltaproteobacteria bacterium]|nr:DMT family transporter [Deltaproteobacteria bacterium]
MTQRTILDVGEPFSYGRPEVLGSILTDFPFLVVLGCTVVGGILINAAYADGRVGVTASVVTIVSAVIPIIAALTIFGERVVPLQIAGIVIVVAGTAMLARRDETPAQSATHGTR